MGAQRKSATHHIVRSRQPLRLVQHEYPTLGPVDWDILLTRLRERECTVFIGAGAISDLLPTGTQIAEKWARRYEYPFQDYALEKVAQFIVVKSLGTPYVKKQLASEFSQLLKGIDQRKKISKSPLGMLARFPVPIYLTTNYDDCLLQALQLAGKKPKVEVCAWNDALSEARAELKAEKRLEFDRKFGPFLEHSPRFEPTPNTPIIFHLHGHEDIPNSLVLTEEDYYNFLIRWGAHSEIIPKRIQAALSSTSLLFIGYRLQDLSFSVIFRSLVAGLPDAQRALNVAVQLPPTDNPAAMRYLTEYFTEMKIKLFWGRASEFAAKLDEEWRKSNEHS